MGTILIKNGAIVTVNEEQEVHNRGYLFIEDDLIIDLNQGDPPSLYEKADEVIDASLMAVMPGMTNAHTHLFQSFIRGLADDKPLLDWLKTTIWPVAAVMN
jgi:5-methylthioadenosine/S-adenosylhomocysteine deaminase